MEKLLKVVINIAKCNDYNLDIDIISNEIIKNKIILLNAAVAGCYIEASLKPGIVILRPKHEYFWINVKLIKFFPFFLEFFLVLLAEMSFQYLNP
tara:strand:+ start:719 stop:1003 length:285 start_codon:yes stop_codon:yes gene_type:complete